MSLGGKMHRTALIILAPIVVATAGELAAATLDESPKNIIAAQIRDQGYKCDSPQSAVRDMRASKPDKDVWVLQCEDASYRVRLIPDMAAKIKRIDKGQHGDK
jgi:hypothetical protein